MFAGVLSGVGSFMPIQGTEIAKEVDHLYGFLLVSSFISFIILIGGMIYFVFKYRRKSSNDKTAYITHNNTLEFLWSFIPFVIFMVVFAWGWFIYHKMRSAPANSFEVQVYGQKWNWTFQYKSGKVSIGELYVPAGVPVKLILTSRDVIHSFFVPAFRIKQDAVPGRYSSLWFEAPNPGVYQVFCTEYCGAAHSSMLAKVHVLPRNEFEAWLSGDPIPGAKPLSLSDQGKGLFASVGCVACHNVDSKSVKVGPSLLGIFGEKQVMSDGLTITVDEQYVRESILNPQAKIVKGFEGQRMLSYQGQLKEEQLAALVEYVKSLK